MCGREESNLHPRRDRDLNPARLPVPPHPRAESLSRDTEIDERRLGGQRLAASSLVDAATASAGTICSNLALLSSTVSSSRTNRPYIGSQQTAAFQSASASNHASSSTLRPLRSTFRWASSSREGKPRSGGDRRASATFSRARSRRSQNRAPTRARARRARRCRRPPRRTRPVVRVVLPTGRSRTSRARDHL